MANGRSISKRILRTLKVIDSGETPTSNESNDVLEVVNAMLDSWRTERLLVYAMQDEILTMVNGKDTYTIGPSGDLVTTRPVRIEDEMFMTEANIDYPILRINKERYASIVDKTSDSDIVEFGYYEGTMPNATLKVWPVPNTPNTLTLKTWIVLTSITLDGIISFPPGYLDAIVHNGAVAFSAETGQLNEVTVSLAIKTKGAIKRVNSKVIQSGTEILQLIGGGRHNILTDT